MSKRRDRASREPVDVPAEPSTPGWWPRERQRDWTRLPVADVDWLVVWNVNLGGGKEAFSVHNKYWGDHPFRPGAVPAERAWVWYADDTQPPESWRDVRPYGGIINRIALTAMGVPTHCGIILLPHRDTSDDLVGLARTIDQEVATHGGAWCPALVGQHDTARVGISFQQCWAPTAARHTAERLSIDDILVVDEFADRAYADAETPRILVGGTRDGTKRRARPGRDALGYVPVPAAVSALASRIG